ncbi:hypothetical protein CYMTET_10899 [Cymbomonas tetramitiformis]|uniref:Uncharacterized protein n=1 Tax=Cymbomonas tetramitiformis TaxID=36881 RepID=A0AAE0GNC3_9CHLO|nr:hypothetical protein CYMTET_10899 [Cymbomonas tetramitiformis]
MKAKYQKPQWALSIDTDPTVADGASALKKHQLALSNMFPSEGGKSSNTAIQMNELVKNFPKAAALGLQLYSASQIKNAVGYKQPYFEFWNKEIERIAVEHTDKKIKAKVDKAVISGRVDSAWKVHGFPAELRAAAARDKGTEEYSSTVSKHLNKLDELCEELESQNRKLQSHKDNMEKEARNMSSTMFMSSTM